MPLLLLLTFQHFWFDEQVAKGRFSAVVGVAILSSVYLPLFLWQWVGINRCAEERGSIGTAADSAIVNGLLLLTACYVVIRMIDVSVSENSYGTERPVAHTGLDPVADSLILSVDPQDKSRLQVTGYFGIASTQQLKEKLLTLAGIETLILESYGGNVFEARGVAKVISDQGLSTHVNGICYSACTLAFVSGARRTASTAAKFGFHAYKMDSDLAGPVFDIEQEMQKDKTIFRKQGLSESFVSAIYNTNPDEIWTPSLLELSREGFLNELTEK